MSNLNELMDRAAREIGPEPSALNGVIRRARRRSLRRRVTAGAVALTLSVGGTALVWSSLRPSGSGPIPGTSTAAAPMIVDSVTVAGKGESVSSVIYAFGRAWVHGMDDEGNGFLTWIDAGSTIPSQRESVAVPSTVVGGGGLAAGAGAVWVAGTGTSGLLRDQALLQRIDPTTGNVIDTVSFGEGNAVDVAVTSSDVWALVRTADETTEAVRLDPTSAKILASVPVPLDQGGRILSVGGGIWVTGRELEKQFVGEVVVVQIDTATNRVIARQRLDNLGAPVVTDGSLWATTTEDSGMSSLQELDPATLSPVGNPIPVAPGIRATGIRALEGRLWIIAYDPTEDQSDSRLIKIDPETPSVETVLDLGPNPVDFAPSSQGVWILEYEGVLLHAQSR